MTPQELKYGILQLAMQGKLVAQHPDEGTGANFLLKIQAEKQTLIKAGKIKKEKPLPQIAADELPFDIPESWTWCRLAAMGQLKNGYSFKSTEYVPDGIQVVRISDLGEDYVDLTNAVFYPMREDLAPYIIENNSFLICMTGSIGKMAWVQDNKIRYLNQRVGMFVPLPSCCHAYLWHFLHSAHVLYGWIRAKTSTNGNIKSSDITDLLVPLPPLAEQKRIVAKLEEILPLIDRYEAAWNKLEAFNKRFPGDMQKSILQLAIQGKLVEQRPEEGTGEELFQRIQAEKQALIKAGKIKKEKPLSEISDDELPFDIPDTWKWTRVAAITTLNPKNDLEDDLETAFIPMPCVMDGFRNQHTFEVKRWKEIKKGFTHFANGDIGVAKITPCFQNRKSVVFHDLKNGYGAGTTELTIVRTIGETVLQEYLLWFFKTDYFITNGMKSFTGTAGQQRIHKDYLATCLIPLPPLEEQKRIVAKLEEILPLCDRLK